MNKKDRAVTEQDFRMPEFIGADPIDYEFRDDGKVVRKDRWKTSMHTVASIVGFSSREGFELPDVVKKVREIMEFYEKNNPDVTKDS